MGVVPPNAYVKSSFAVESYRNSNLSVLLVASWISVALYMLEITLAVRSFQRSSPPLWR
jgi:hypothetical protein